MEKKANNMNIGIPMSKMVLATVSEFVKDHPEATYADIERIFPLHTSVLLELRQFLEVLLPVFQMFLHFFDRSVSIVFFAQPGRCQLDAVAAHHPVFQLPVSELRQFFPADGTSFYIITHTAFLLSSLFYLKKIYLYAYQKNSSVSMNIE